MEAAVRTSEAKRLCETSKSAKTEFHVTRCGMALRVRVCVCASTSGRVFFLLVPYFFASQIYNNASESYTKWKNCVCRQTCFAVWRDFLSSCALAQPQCAVVSFHRVIYLPFVPTMPTHTSDVWCDRKKIDTARGTDTHTHKYTRQNPLDSLAPALDGKMKSTRHWRVRD